MSASARSRRLAPRDVVASFDSATVLHAGLVAALRGRPFPHLGHGPLTAAAVRAAGRLPWPILRRLYTRIGASEGIDQDRLADVDMAAVAATLAEDYPPRRYPAALIGASNGALTHLAAALQIPWLPGTVLIPVARSGDPQRPIDALRFGAQAAPPLLEANPDVVLHHMHDQVQDELMVARMTYFRVKWSALPDAYARFLTTHLAPGALERSTDRLLVPSFVLGDPWRTLNAAAVPFWTVFCVQPALHALDAHLAASPRYRTVDILAFQHGVHSAGIAEPEQWLAVARRHGADARLLALDPSRFPHDIATLGRYGHALADLAPAHRPWTPPDVTTAIHSLHAAGLTGPAAGGTDT